MSDQKRVTAYGGRFIVIFAGSVCLLSSREFNLSRCSGCAYQFRAIVVLLLSWSK